MTDQEARSGVDMNREQMIEKAAKLIWLEEIGDVVVLKLLEEIGDVVVLKLAEVDQWWETTAHADRHRAVARQVLDAILPQVTTVEELEALPDGSVLADNLGAMLWRRRLQLLRDIGGNGYDREPNDVLIDNPLTVVWTPT
jgi:hypothetical protein